MAFALLLKEVQEAAPRLNVTVRSVKAAVERRRACGERSLFTLLSVSRRWSSGRQA